MNAFPVELCLKIEHSEADSRMTVSWEGTMRADLDTRVRVLVVEDDQDSRMAIEKRLVAAGYSVRSVDDVDPVLPAIQDFDPQVVLLDLGLPSGDGIRLLGELRTRGDTAQLPVVVLSARDSAYSVDRALEVGADYYLTKPVDADKLLWTVERACAASTAV